MGEAGYNTNLAAEFHVVSVLHRLGANPTLTLGNKKSVDIVVESEGSLATIDVKGLAGKTGFPVDNLQGKRVSERHFVVFVCFKGRIGDPAVMPDVWVVPAADVARLTYHAPGGVRHVVPLTNLQKADGFKDAWHLLAPGIKRRLGAA